MKVALPRPRYTLVDAPSFRDLAYLLLGGAFGILWFGLIAALYLIAVFSTVALMALPFLLGAQALLRPIGRFERFLVRTLLRQDLREPAPIRFDHTTASRTSSLTNFWRWSLAVFRDVCSWRVLVWILVRSVIGPLGFIFVVLSAVVPLSLLLAPLVPLVDWISDAFSIDHSWKYWLLFGPIAFPIVTPLLTAIIRGLADLHRELALWALGPGHQEIVAAVLARAAQAEEQVRIDQELHDSIGHMLSMIVVQAGAGAYVFDKNPDFARQSLENISERARAALGELDRIIASIRSDQIDQHTPLPTSTDLPDLVTDAREAGMNVSARIRTDTMSPELSRSVYRIVQESLTNAAKHAPGSTVNIDVAADNHAVSVSVVNNHTGMALVPGRAGRGLASIRYRATLLGGEATVGEMTQGKSKRGESKRGEFAVRAVLPLTAMLPEGAHTRCDLTPQCDCLGCAIRRRVLG